MPEPIIEGQTEPVSTAPVANSVPAPTANQEPTQTTGSAENTSPAPAAANLPDNWEWNGNVDEVEPQFRKRALGMQRYLTKRSQELAESQRKAEEFDRIKTDPSYQQYLNSRNGYQDQKNVSQPQPILNPSEVVSQKEWEQLGLDPGVGQVINKLIESRLMVAEQQVGGLLSELTAKQAHIERSQEIQDFAELHPDFWELYDAGLLQPMVREMVDTRKGTLLDAYNKAKSIKDKFRNEAIQKSQERVAQKKAAFTAPPSASNEPDTIWADNPNDSFRLAFENALQNKRIPVRTRRK